jgi:hypothetical protein
LEPEPHNFYSDAKTISQYCICIRLVQIWQKYCSVLCDSPNMHNIIEGIMQSRVFKVPSLQFRRGKYTLCFLCEPMRAREMFLAFLLLEDSCGMFYPTNLETWDSTFATVFFPKRLSLKTSESKISSSHFRHHNLQNYNNT